MYILVLMLSANLQNIQLKSLKRNTFLRVIHSSPNTYDLICDGSANSPCSVFKINRIDANTFMLQNIEYPGCWVNHDGNRLSAHGKAGDDCLF